MAYFAYIDPSSKVARVIVVDSAKLAAELTGTNESDWIETKRNDAQEKYAGIGDDFDPNAREKFKPPVKGAGGIGKV